MPSQLGKSLGMLRGNVGATQYALRAGLRDGHAAQGGGIARKGVRRIRRPADSDTFGYQCGPQQSIFVR